MRRLRQQQHRCGQVVAEGDYLLERRNAEDPAALPPIRNKAGETIRRRKPGKTMRSPHRRARSGPPRWVDGGRERVKPSEEKPDGDLAHLLRLTPQR